MGEIFFVMKNSEVSKPRVNPGHPLIETHEPWISTLRDSSIRPFRRQCVLESQNFRSPKFWSGSESLVVGGV
jgi:hypothetical protein